MLLHLIEALLFADIIANTLRGGVHVLVHILLKEDSKARIIPVCICYAYRTILKIDCPHHLRVSILVK